ncbi:hypothetical protein GMLC_01510 [Geomonas limicola]|uniref:Ice-binding protein C-terminal domain-containing protein n=1 Tax=Geomonas limicola TaxID=2740186 RepID=A0A6V8N262_9BACT|nr:PEP-CTERM sorting domain-containing protein [Geomonas limicola]GFO66572.1 hypothetical protein GMLC_01510 [Geomonas limicola]
MKKLVALLAGAMLFVGMTTAAQALTVKYSTDLGVSYQEASSNTGFLSISIPGLNSDLMTITSSTVKLPNLAALNTTNIWTNFTSGGSLWIQVSDEPYNISMPNGMGATAKTGLTYQLGTNVDLETFYGSGLFDMSHLISDMDVPSFATSFETKLLPTITDPFSLTEFLMINMGPGSSLTTASLQLTPVPEPGTMMLLGAGFLGLAIYGKRRKNA